MVLKRPNVAAGLALALVLFGCGDDPTGSGVPSQDAAEDTAGQADSVTRDAVLPDSATEDGGEVTDGAADLGPTSIVPEGCNPIAFDHDCLLPYPSDVFLIDDETMPSGRRLVVPEAALPRSREGEPMDITRLHPGDGFAFHPLILAYFPEGIDPAGLVFHSPDPGRSLVPASTTLLLREDGTPILHFAELDMRSEAAGQRALQIRPLVRLDEQTRYIVAIRGLTTPDGEAVEAPPGFRELRDGDAGDDPVLGPLSARYDSEIFPVLQEFGVDRDRLILAWDFTTQSMAHVTDDMLAVRTDVLRRLAEESPTIRVNAVETSADGLGDHIFRRVRGTIEVPLYTEENAPGALLHYGADGRPAANGTAEAPFVVIIPQIVADKFTDGKRAPIVQYGHGFFGSLGEVEGAASHIAAELGVVMVATEWSGMTTNDAALVGGTLLLDVPGALAFTDRVHQGMANFLALGEAVQTTLAETDAMQIDGQLVYDAGNLTFYGISQGGILGGVYMALTPIIERAILGVSGASFTFMMSRARPFAPFIQLMSAQVDEPLTVQKGIAAASTIFDRIDPITYAPLVFDGPAGAQRRILMQVGIGDDQVPLLASELHARALGLPLLSPAPRAAPALETVTVPQTGHDISALVEFGFGVDPLPGTNSVLPTTSNCVHEAVRRSGQANAQITAFILNDRVVISPCGEEACVTTCD